MESLVSNLRTEVFSKLEQVQAQVSNQAVLMSKISQLEWSLTMQKSLTSELVNILLARSQQLHTSNTYMLDRVKNLQQNASNMKQASDSFKNVKESTSTDAPIGAHMTLLSTNQNAITDDAAAVFTIIPANEKTTDSFININTSTPVTASTLLPEASAISHDPVATNLLPAKKQQHVLLSLSLPNKLMPLLQWKALHAAVIREIHPLHMIHK